MVSPNCFNKVWCILAFMMKAMGISFSFMSRMDSGGHSVLGPLLGTNQMLVAQSFVGSMFIKHQGGVALEKMHWWLGVRPVLRCRNASAVDCISLMALGIPTWQDHRFNQHMFLIISIFLLVWYSMLFTDNDHACVNLMWSHTWCRICAHVSSWGPCSFCQQVSRSLQGVVLPGSSWGNHGVTSLWPWVAILQRFSSVGLSRSSCFLDPLVCPSFVLVEWYTKLGFAIDKHGTCQFKGSTKIKQVFFSGFTAVTWWHSCHLRNYPFESGAQGIWHTMNFLIHK